LKSFEEDVIELIQEFKRNSEKLKKYTDSNGVIMMDNMLDFKDHAQAILGQELDDVFNYIIHKYNLSKLPNIYNF
jgi:hypothetical protein